MRQRKSNLEDLRKMDAEMEVLVQMKAQSLKEDFAKGCERGYEEDHAEGRLESARQLLHLPPPEQLAQALGLGLLLKAVLALRPADAPQ